MNESKPFGFWHILGAMAVYFAVIGAAIAICMALLRSGGAL